MSPAHAGAFLRSRERLEDPDPQFVFTPANHSAEGVNGALQRTPGTAVGVWRTRPESRCHVRVRSPDRKAAPPIRPDCLSAPEDRAAAVSGLRVAVASAIPAMVSADTNAAMMLVAERAAAMALEERREAAAAAA
jgi:choline dehydrogenase-like flavoprotein